MNRANETVVFHIIDKARNIHLMATDEKTADECFLIMVSCKCEPVMERKVIKR